MLSRFSDIFPAIAGLVILYFYGMASANDDVGRLLVGLSMIPTFATAVILAPQYNMKAASLFLASVLWPVTVLLWLVKKPG